MKITFFNLSMLVIVLLFILCIIYPFAANENFAVKINNDRISSEEFSAYMRYEQLRQPDTTNLTQSAVSTAVSVYAAVRYARQNGITPDLQDEQAINSLFEELYKNTEISEKVLKKVCRNIIIYEKIYKYVTDSFVLSDNDLDSLFSEYYEKNKKELNSISVSYIFISSENDISYIEEVYGKALDGYNFSGLAVKYSEKDEYFTDDVKNSDFDDTVIDAIFDMTEDEIIMLETDKGYYIIKANKIITPNLDELKESIREDCIKKRKNEIYSQQNDKWLENDVIEKNENL